MIAINYIHTPEPTDILCGRGNIYVKHHGNIVFNETIAQNVASYSQAPTRQAKSNVVASIISQLKSNGHRFIKLDKLKGTWYELDRDSTHDKVGHAIRDLAKTLQSGGKTATKKRTINQLKSTVAKPSAPSKKDIPMDPMNSGFNALVVDMQNFHQNSRGQPFSFPLPDAGSELFPPDGESTAPSHRSPCNSPELDCLAGGHDALAAAGPAMPQNPGAHFLEMPAGEQHDSQLAPLPLEIEPQMDAGEIKMVLDCLGMNKPSGDHC